MATMVAHTRLRPPVSLAGSRAGPRNLRRAGTGVPACARSRAASQSRSLCLRQLRLEAPACPAQELTAPDTEQSGHGASSAMIAGMGKAQDPGTDSRVDSPRDVEVSGDLPMSLTTFVGRERELDELRSLFREGKRLVTLVGI